ncbi:MAG TPA: hypothetical protein VFW00_15045 [Rhodocyclaceae bacterium]|nr:hypothetical protein [Rhodocyclaceae bacterium]
MDEHDPGYESSKAEPIGLMGGLITILIGASLLAAAVWIGSMVRQNPTNFSYRIDDPQRAVVYLADPTGDVRVLSVRGGISEIARLHDPQRHAIRHMELDPFGHRLKIAADNANYIYDTRNFALIERRIEVAAQTATASGAN